MAERFREIKPEPDIPEVLKTPHTYGVVMPYSSNLDGKGEPHLSFYSAFALKASFELYRKNYIKKMLLCGESTFGKGKKATNDLMKEALLRLGVPEHDIIIINQTIDAPNMPQGVITKSFKLDNTALQIKALSEFQKENGLQNERFLIIDWGFHDERVKNHIGIHGFRLNAETFSTEEAHKFLSKNQSFDPARLQKILPKEFEKREKWPRRISRIDNKGFLPRFLTKALGPSVTDIKKVREKTTDGKPGKLLYLALENTTGRKKLKEIRKKRKNESFSQTSPSQIFPNK